MISHKDGVSRCYHLAKPGLMKDLFAALGRDYPTVKLGDPEPCRAARKPRRRPRPARQRRAASKT